MVKQIAKVSEVPQGEKKLVNLSDRSVVLINLQGALYAIDNRCPHMGGSLYAGKLDGERITCPRHGATFDVKTGKALQGPKIAFIQMNVKDATVYPVKVEGDDILIDIG